MDELPDLRSDQDVDILLSRLRARIAPPAPSPTPGVVATSGSSPAWNDFVTAQREAAATMLRALSVLADAVDELAADTPVATPVAASGRARAIGIASADAIAEDRLLGGQRLRRQRLGGRPGEHRRCHRADGIWRTRRRRSVVSRARRALRKPGTTPTRCLSTPTNPASMPCSNGYARCYALDLRAYDLVISTKAPTFMVSHPNHVSYLLHTLRVFYDMFETEYGAGSELLQAQRRTVYALDRFGLRPGRVRRHFANGHTTTAASSTHRNGGSRSGSTPCTIRPLSRISGAPAQDYILMPGRLHRWKRVDLVIDAYKHVKRDVPLLITGTGEDEKSLRAAAAGDGRIRFLGNVDESALADLYAEALLVPFVPKHEDYGLITIEAFKSGKPVLTCTRLRRDARIRPRRRQRLRRRARGQGDRAANHARH